MRLITFEADTKRRPGVMLDDLTVVDLQRAFAIAQGDGTLEKGTAAPGSLVDIIMGGDRQKSACETVLAAAKAGALASACRPIADVALMAPIPRPTKNVFCVGSNYRAHVSESSRAQQKADKAPEYPVFFTKPPTAVIGPEAAIRLDPQVSTRMDYEVELAVVIGKAGCNIPAARAIDHIFGFTIVNDITARDLQRRHGGQFLKGKGLDTSCPMGPCIVTIDELTGFEALGLRLTVNGEVRQDGNTRDMMFSIPRLIESLSEGLTLEPGDILATGTPSGVGYAMDPPRYLEDGDTITCEIEGIGALTNTMRDVSTAAFAA